MKVGFRDLPPFGSILPDRAILVGLSLGMVPHFFVIESTAPVSIAIFLGCLIVCYVARTTGLLVAMNLDLRKPKS